MRTNKLLWMFSVDVHEGHNIVNMVMIDLICSWVLTLSTVVDFIKHKFTCSCARYGTNRWQSILKKRKGRGAAIHTSCQFSLVHLCGMQGAGDHCTHQGCALFFWICLRHVPVDLWQENEFCFCNCGLCIAVWFFDFTILLWDVKKIIKKCFSISSISVG